MPDTRDELRPRKDAKQLRAQLTLEAVFEAATQIMVKAGEEMTTHQIAERAGVSVGSLYQYFPSKDALFRWLIHRHLDKRVKGVRTMIASVKGLPAEEAARRLIEQLVGEKVPLLRMEQALMRYFVSVGDLETLTQKDSEMIEAVKEFLDGLSDQLRPVDTDLAAFIVNNALRSSILMAILQRPETLVTPEFKRELTELVVRYLRKSSS